MHVEPGRFQHEMAVQRGRIAGGTTHGNHEAVAVARRRLTLLKVQRLAEAAADLFHREVGDTTEEASRLVSCLNEAALWANRIRLQDRETGE